MRASERTLEDEVHSLFNGVIDALKEELGATQELTDGGFDEADMAERLYEVGLNKREAKEMVGFLR